MIRQRWTVRIVGRTGYTVEHQLRSPFLLSDHDAPGRSGGDTGRFNIKVALDCETICTNDPAQVPMFDPSIGVGTRFRKGVSGNPGGRPRMRVLSEALRAQLGEIKPDDPAGRTHAEIVAANLIDTEGPGAVHAASEIADRLEGRARQQVEIAD